MQEIWKKLRPFYEGEYREPISKIINRKRIESRSLEDLLARFDRDEKRMAVG